MVMGLSGFTIAAERAEEMFALSFRFSIVVLALSAILFVVLTAAYGAKVIRFRQSVAEELDHPVTLSLFPTFSISLILLSIAMLPFSGRGSLVLCIVGTALHLALTLLVLSRWINHTAFDIQHSNPSWFIPVVGNILVPIAGIPHGFREISWFFFSVGLLFWVVLLTIVVYRVIFYPPLPERLVPTFFILIAPPSVGFISYFKLTGSLDVFGRILFYAAMFFMALLLSLFRKFVGIRFFLSWWAYSFPIAAFAIASMLMYRQVQNVFFLVLSMVMLTLLPAVIMMLTCKTLAAVGDKRICVADSVEPVCP